MEAYDKLVKAVNEIRKITNFVPEIGVVLGSGLGEFSGDIKVLGKISYGKIPGFPVSTVDGHSGQFIFGYVEKVPVVLMNGRVHYYEGYDMEDVVMPVRIMAMLGAGTIILTNAAGGINKSFYAGGLMLISDHISSFVPSPLRGRNIDELGTRFPDMSNVYDKGVKNIILGEARHLQIPIREGVYAQMPGPAYETPAEVKMLGVLGADAVGMSTACEALALNHMGIRVAGISCITNMAAGLSKAPLSHEEVKTCADLISEKFRSLVWHSILAIAAEDKDRKNKESKKAVMPKTTQKPALNSELNFDDMEVICFK